MLETQCAKIMLRPGSLSQVEEWANELNHRPQEVLQTLRDEGVVIESGQLLRPLIDYERLSE